MSECIRPNRPKLAFNDKKSFQPILNKFKDVGTSGIGTHARNFNDYHEQVYLLFWKAPLQLDQETPLKCVMR